MKALVMKVAIKTKVSCGPSGFAADNCGRILVYKSFSSCSIRMGGVFCRIEGDIVMHVAREDVPQVAEDYKCRTRCCSRSNHPCNVLLI